MRASLTATVSVVFTKIIVTAIIRIIISAIEIRSSISVKPEVCRLRFIDRSPLPDRDPLGDRGNVAAGEPSPHPSAPPAPGGDPPDRAGELLDRIPPPAVTRRCYVV